MPKFDYHKKNPTSSTPTKLPMMHPPKRSNRGRKASCPTPPAEGPARVTKRSSPPAHRPVKLTLKLNPPKPLVEAEAVPPFNSRSSSKSTLVAEDSDPTLSDQEMIFGPSSPKASRNSDEDQVHDAAIILFDMRNNTPKGAKSTLTISISLDKPGTYPSSGIEPEFLWEKIRLREQREKEAIAMEVLEGLKSEKRFVRDLEMVRETWRRYSGKQV